MRLTKRDGGGNAVMDCDNCEIKYQEGCCSKQLCRNGLINKLADYEDAEEQGRLMILPCKAGDTVYYLTGNPTFASGYHFNRVESTKCIGFYWDRSGLQICLQMPKGNHGTYGRFGETIFLTREEAEAALRGETKDV